MSAFFDNPFGDPGQLSLNLRYSFNLTCQFQVTVFHQPLCAHKTCATLAFLSYYLELRAYTSEYIFNQ
jgi:hypothetical protein